MILPNGYVNLNVEIRATVIYLPTIFACEKEKERDVESNVQGKYRRLFITRRLSPDDDLAILYDSVLDDNVSACALQALLYSSCLKGKVVQTLANRC